MIFYNSLSPAPRARFTIAHELGHFVLGHVAPGRLIKTPVLFRQSGAPVSKEESEANVFASRLLAPACVLWGLGINSAADIAKVCNISQQAAEYRMERMEELYAREKAFLEYKGHSCFLTEKLERQVFNQFKPFIEQYKL